MLTGDLNAAEVEWSVQYRIDDPYKYLFRVRHAPQTFRDMNEAVMPIDTHVHRTSKRLGLIGANVSADKAHDLFAQALPPEWVYPLHVNLITHGRKICHAQRPDCGHCTLYEVCAYVGSVKGQETALEVK